MSNVNRFTSFLANLDTVVVASDFVEEHADTLFTDTLTDSGSAAVGDDVNGIMTLTPSDGTVADNDEAILASTNELFKFGTNREIYGACKFRYTEVSATIANVGFGFVNAAATDPLGDNGAGVKTSGSTLAIAKVDGGAVWRTYSATNGTAVTNVSTTAATAATDYVVEIICIDADDGVNMTASFKVNGEYLKDSAGTIIRHNVVIASATEMNAFAAIKLGAATNNDTMLIDWLYAAQSRV